jgi:hypothetical protein
VIPSEQEGIAFPVHKTLITENGIHTVAAPDITHRDARREGIPCSGPCTVEMGAAKRLTTAS